MARQNFTSKSQRIQHGFTLLELLISSSILSITMAIAVPGYEYLVGNFHSRIVKDEMMESFYHGRRYALKYGKEVTLCGSSNGYDCDKQWKEIIVFEDSNDNNARDGGEKLIFSTDTKGNEESIHSYRRYFRFRTTGALASQPDSIYYCSDEEARNWRVVVARVGRVRWTTESRDDGPLCKD